MFNECFSCICIGFSEFNKPGMCKFHIAIFFFSIMLFVLPFRTEHSGGLKHKCCLSELTAIDESESYGNCTEVDVRGDWSHCHVWYLMIITLLLTNCI